MKLGIGIDTGGTYTDAAIYDFDSKQVLYSAKALTTKEDLKTGIGNALDALPLDICRQAVLVSLSTTLATNACVEGIGGRGKLIFIGADKEVVDKTGKSYGLPNSSEIFFLDGKVNYRGEIEVEPDWDLFLKDSKKWMEDADAIAVVQQLGIRNSETEEKAKALIVEKYGLNTICGHELFSDLNYIKRGSSTLLNARLIPVIEGFLSGIKEALKERGISAPVVIVRSDGSLMSENFTSIRPVETLLCGPAASVMGGVELTGEKNCLIIDMGGTTTDIALVKDGVPIKAKNGVNVGDWQTFVKAVYIDTFGLGGDSYIRVNKIGELVLGSNRVIPLSIAAERWPQITRKLDNLVRNSYVSQEPLHEFFYLVKGVPDSKRFSEEEIALCKALQEGPLIYSEAVDVLKKRAYTSQLDRLEREGIIMRCGITPTDFMHAKGDFSTFNKSAALLGIAYLKDVYSHINNRNSKNKITTEEFCDKAYDLVKEKLYLNIVRILLEDQYPDYKKKGLDETTKSVIRDSWKSFTEGSKSFLNVNYNISSASLVGVGAPIHIFLPDVAKALGAKHIIPENAGAANAIGAIIGNIRAVSNIKVKPDEEGGFIVFGIEKNYYLNSYREAVDIAMKEAKNEARREAIRRGATGDISVTLSQDDNTELSEQLGGTFLSTVISATAVGRLANIL